ncbi:response regulator [Caulobacter sp. KR2-114]|uniref:response regulator n=1 Tax=Caulobacter sp. KR2-114 TaxID=3400912 RepID=UPI003C0C8AA8
MDTLSRLIDRRDPVAADCACETILERFIRDPAALALAVVDHGMPVGVIARETFLARMEVPGAGDLSARAVMSAPPTVVCETAVAAEVAADLSRTAPETLLGGFIVVDEAGAYAGVCTAVSLLGAAAASPTAAPTSNLIERITAESREPVMNTLAAIERMRRFRLPEDAVACLETISEASHGMLDLLETAADLHRAQTAELRLEAEPRRLQDLMDEVEARWRAKADIAGLTLLVSYDGDPDCAAMTDSPRLIQVFDALIGHALTNARTGVIEASLKTSPAGSRVALRGRVRDNGALYDGAYLQRMFDDDAAPAPRSTLGVALGLALAGRAIGAMGGRLSAEPNIGAGATISFEIDLAAAEAISEQSVQAEAQGGRSAHVLVVDDNATNRMVVEALCEMFDCSTESVADGVEAVEAAKAGRFDVILMDIKMPRMDGVTATREIRKLKGPAGSAPIVALTANADPDEAREYMAAGMLCVVEKPIKPERLLEALDMALAAKEVIDKAAAA